MTVAQAVWLGQPAVGRAQGWQPAVGRAQGWEVAVAQGWGRAVAVALGWLLVRSPLAAVGAAG